MNINITIECETCGDPTNCRIGLSNREVQPLQFNCQTCGSSIEITLRKHAGGSFVGAKQIKDRNPFEEKANFVDLHLDFPVSFEKYVTGMTPFMRASLRVGPELMMLHQQRLEFLNHEHPNFRFFSLIIKLYINEKWTPFKETLRRRFNVDVASNEPQDINAALYQLISHVMIPFAYPNQDREAVDLFTRTINRLGREHKTATKSFMKDMLDTAFLKNLQVACLGIYPKILDAELPLRPALFLDFDDEFKNNPIPMRVSNAAFESLRDLYKDISEIISRQFILVAGINNLLKRGNHDSFLPEIGRRGNGSNFTPKSLQEYANVAFGKKLDYIDGSWFDFMKGAADNKLRNAIAHHKTEYDEVKQIVTYFPRLEGIKQEKAESISFLQFMRQLLISYREMHRLHHLIKCLFYLHLIVLRRAP